MDKKKNIAKKMPNTEIVIIRHGSTKLNNANKIRGWIDVPLDEKGKQEAKDAAKLVKKEGLTGLIASDLDRTQETAAIISKYSGVPLIKVSKDFRPWHVGIHSGHDADKVHKILADMVENEPDKQIDGGESFNEFKDRFIEGIKKVRKSYKGKIGIVTHYRGDRIYCAWKAKGFPDNNEVDIKEFNKLGIDPGKLNK